MKYQDSCCDNFESLYEPGKQTALSSETGYSSDELTGFDSLVKKAGKVLTNLEREHHVIE
jgi:hypothetical protein